MTDDAAQRLRADLLDLADFAYERLRGRLAGLTDEEYLWEPAPGCWSVRPSGDGAWHADASGPLPPEPAPLTTIAWRVCHVIDLLAATRNATWLGLALGDGLDPVGEPGTAAAAIGQLQQAYTLFRGCLTAVGAEDLGAEVGAVGGPYAHSTRTAFVLHQLDEFIHHGAEIGTLRDLFRATRPLAAFPAAVRSVERSTARALPAADPGLRERYPALVAEMAAAQNWPALRLAVDLGFDVNVWSEISALHYAAGCGELASVRLLVEHGADPHARDGRFDLPPAGWARYFHQEAVHRYLALLSDTHDD